MSQEISPRHSIKALRDDWRQVGGNPNAMARLIGAIDELEALRAERDSLKQWYENHTEREAAACPDGVSCTEYIGLLLDTVEVAVAERNQLAASLARVWSLASHDMECPQRSGGVCDCAFLSTPAADLAAHDRAVLEAAVDRYRKAAIPHLHFKWVEEAIMNQGEVS